MSSISQNISFSQLFEIHKLILKFIFMIWLEIRLSSMFGNLLLDECILQDCGFEVEGLELLSSFVGENCKEEFCQMMF